MGSERDAVRLPRRLLDELAAAAEAAWPSECCGLLVGNDGAGGTVCISRLAPSPNRAPDPARNFEVEPQLWLDLRRELAGGPERIVGLYHSHPEGGADPSPRDLGAAWYIEPGAGGVVWLIAALREGRVAETRAHVFTDAAHGFRPARLEALD